jgi:uncharacterized protein (TIGR00369 family)
MTEMKTLEQLQQRLDNTPFAAWLGIVVESSDEAGVVMRLSSRRELQGSPSTKSLHGGVAASLIDTASSYAVMARTGRTIATIDMRVDYHRAGNSDLYRIEGSVVKLGRTIATADAKITDSSGALIASGRTVVMHMDR